MSSIIIPAGAKQVTFEAVVNRNDGTTEDLGIIFYWNANPFKMLAWGFKQFFKGVWKWLRSSQTPAKQ